jgi:hypothetical protein
MWLVRPPLKSQALSVMDLDKSASCQEIKP